jgi:hypothetical protein
LFIFFAHLEFPGKFFCTHEGTVPYRSSAQMSCREEVGVYCCTRYSRTAHSTPLISISRDLAPFDKHSWKIISLIGLFQSSAPSSFCWRPRGRGLSTQLVNIFLGARVNGIRATWHVHPTSLEAPRLHQDVGVSRKGDANPALSPRLGTLLCTWIRAGQL